MMDQMAFARGIIRQEVARGGFRVLENVQARIYEYYSRHTFDSGEIFRLVLDEQSRQEDIQKDIDSLIEE